MTTLEITLTLLLAVSAWIIIDLRNAWLKEKSFTKSEVSLHLKYLKLYQEEMQEKYRFQNKWTETCDELALVKAELEQYKNHSDNT
jgi:hypothetical protein